MYCISKFFSWRGFPSSSDGKESACNAGDLGLIPGLGKIPWRRERLPTSVFRPGEFHGLYSPWGCKESDATERFKDEVKIPCSIWILSSENDALSD